MLVRDGAAGRTPSATSRAWREHEALYGEPLPAELAARACPRAAGNRWLECVCIAPRRARHGPARPDARCREPRLAPVTLALATPWWARRPQVARPAPWSTALARRGGAPLLVDLDGDVLEAAMREPVDRGGRTLVTPPLDGRQLPGTVRARLLDRRPRRERSGSTSAWRAADEIFLSSSWRRARAAEGRGGPASRLAGAAAARRRCWRCRPAAGGGR